MKPFFVGLTVLSSVVGLGSAGAYYGHHLLSGPAPAVADTPADVGPRDLTPAPLPLAAADAQEMPKANPFGRTVARVETEPDAEPAAAAGEVDRYGRQSTAAAKHAAADEPLEDDPQLPGPSPGDDIPVANPAADAGQMPAETAADPLGLEERIPVGPRGAKPAGRYPERPAAAELPEEEAKEPTAEPRALRPEVARSADADRYGRAQAPGAVPAGEEPAAPEAEPQPLATRQQFAPAAVQPEPTAEEPAATAEGTGRPGDPRLSGAQSPTLAIEKTAPSEIQIGKAAKFTIKVRNIGAVVAHGVEVHDTIPQGTQLVNATPAAKRGAEGELVWELGSLKPSDEQTVELELMPMAEGEIGSVATVHFRAEASVRTLATKPMLKLEVSAPPKVMKGEEVALKIKISNPGSGAATKVVLSENVPEGLKHPGGAELELEIGTLKPGESRELDLGLMATGAGVATNIVTAHGEGNLQAEAQTDVEVVAPLLQVGMTGPKRRYLERNATHQISISNPGTASAKDVELVAVLPRELKFVEANNGGQFDAATHSVYWSLEELPPQETGTVTLTTLPLTAGDAKVLIKSKAQQNLSDQREEIVAIEGMAAINFQLSDASDPIESGGKETYQVRVTNQGTKAASNVRVVALLPPEMKAVAGEGPVRYRIEGQQIVFEPLKQLAPKAEVAFSISTQALQAGDLRVQVQITTDEIREPITKEESTRVYGEE